MAKKTNSAKKNNTAAVIDIGSNDMKLLIAQAVKNEDDSQPARSVKYLERLSYPLGLGRDTFQTGKMSFEKANKACEIIHNFLNAARDYGVKNIKAVATTAVREATNMDYILDQIKIKTGLTVNVLDDSEEKRYLYKLLTHYIGDTLKQSAMMVYIGAGNVGVSVLRDGRMPFLNNIRMGSLRVGELFGDLDEYTSEFYRLMEEYLAGFTEVLAEEIPSDIKYFIASGQEIGLIAQLVSGKGPSSGENFPGDGWQSGGWPSHKAVFEIRKSGLLTLYNDIKQKTADQIAVDYGIDHDRADVLLPAVCIYHNLLCLTKADRIVARRELPCDAVLFEMLQPKLFAALDKTFNKHTLLSAKTLARRFQACEKHYSRVYAHAMTLFDKMKKIHGLGSRDKLLLQTAAILHDTGKCINNRAHYRHSYMIARGSDVVGLTQLESEIAALLCLYHSRIAPSTAEPHYAALNVHNRMRVSKLAAILRLADALDRSHKQKFEKITVRVTDEALTVTVVTDENIALEQWAFKEKGRFFEEVYGIKAELKTKRVTK